MTLFGVRPPQPGPIQASETPKPSVRISGPVEPQKLYLDRDGCSLGQAGRVNESLAAAGGASNDSPLALVTTLA